MTSRQLSVFILIIALNFGLAACASSAGTQDARNAQRCPSGQVLVCKGGETNSRVKDSELNRTDVCICRQQDRF